MSENSAIEVVKSFLNILEVIRDDGEISPYRNNQLFSFRIYSFWRLMRLIHLGKFYQIDV
jgi:hypothetical protein